MGADPAVGHGSCETSTQQLCTELEDRSPPKAVGEGLLETLKRDKLVT